jgi:sugar/nucleoside kinase (ribokinase family)
LCVVGDFAWDVLIRTNNEVLKGGDSFGEVLLHPGGSAANVAVWARRCGLDTHFIGKIGRDRLGDLAREDLERERVVHHFIQTDAHLTGSVAVFVDQTGERSMVSGRGADFFLLPQELRFKQGSKVAFPISAALQPVRAILLSVTPSRLFRQELVSVGSLKTRSTNTFMHGPLSTLLCRHRGKAR